MTEPASAVVPSVRRRFVPDALFALALLAWVAFGAARWESKNPFDLYQFWLVAHAAATPGVTDVYGESDQQRIVAAALARAERSGSALELAGARTWSSVGMEPTATPFFYALVSLLSSDDFERDARIFRVVSLALYAGAVAALALLAGAPPWAALGATVLFTQLFWPFYTDTGFGNVGQLQVAAIALLVLLLRRDGAARELGAGALLGALLLFKPTVLHAGGLLALHWLASGQTRRLLRVGAGAFAGAAAAFVTPAVRFGDACTWGEWRAAFPRLMLTDRYLGGGLLGQLFGVRSIPLFTLFGLALFAAAATFVVRATRRRRSETGGARGPLDELTLLGCGLALYLLSGPIVHSHYFLLAVPLALLALRPGQSIQQYGWAALAIVLVAAHPQIRALGLTAAPNHSPWSFLGVAILLVLGLASFRSAAHSSSSVFATPL